MTTAIIVALVDMSNTNLLQLTLCLREYCTAHIDTRGSSLSMMLQVYLVIYSDEKRWFAIEMHGILIAGIANMLAIAHIHAMIDSL